MESSGVGSAGCAVHVDVHGERVVLWVALGAVKLTVLLLMEALDMAYRGR